MNKFVFNIETKCTPIKGVAMSNRLLRPSVFKALNDACHNAIRKYNGELDWCDVFVKFEHNGKKYEQILSEPCDKCVFNQDFCLHPYFTTKPYCLHKIYVEVKSDSKR